jgi:hypothetical protein
MKEYFNDILRTEVVRLRWKIKEMFLFDRLIKLILTVGLLLGFAYVILFH